MSRAARTAIGSLVIALILLPVASQAQSGRAPRVVPIRSGTATITLDEGGDDLVTIADSAGELIAESHCPRAQGTYAEYAEFFRRVQAGFQHRDDVAIARLTNFPLRVNSAPARSWPVRSPQRLMVAFDSVFTSPVIAKLLAADPGAVFCRDGLAMMGDGEVWAGPTPTGLKIFVINQ